MLELILKVIKENRTGTWEGNSFLGLALCWGKKRQLEKIKYIPYMYEF